jgi:flagellar hook protein FlgE
MSLLSGLQISVQGVSAQSNRLSTIGTNIANVNTTGYKASDVAFEALMADSPVGYQGPGVQPALRLNASAQGSITSSDTATNLAISGNGFFVVQTPGGVQAMTRAGAFTREANGTLVNTAGDTLLGYAAGSSGLAPVVIPDTATGVVVSGDGTLSVSTPTGVISPYSVPLAQVRGPESLTAMSGDDYVANDQSGAMAVSQAGTDGLGTIAGSSLESSTSDLATQLTNMIVTQRGYEANSKVMQTTSDMLSKLSDL